MSSAQSFGALSGLTVLDLTQMLAGPFCSQLFSDHGARVIKIEPPAGEDIRRSGPFAEDDTERAFGGYFASVNRNKEGMCLDLKNPDARNIFLRMVEDADIVLENYRAGVMDKLGLGYEVLKKRNPRIVYGAIRGFGDPRSGASPYLAWPAFDVVAQAMGGLMQINGPDAQTPMKCGPGVGDVFPAVMCAFGVLAALHHVEATGEGQFVDVSMVDSVLALCERTVYQNSFTNAVPHPEGNRHPLLSPFGMVRAEDGYVTISGHTDMWWSKLCELIGRQDLIADARTSTEEARVRNRDLVYEVLEGFTSIRTKKDLMTILGGKVPFGPVFNISEISEDKHFEVRGMLVEVEHPGMARPVKIAGIPVKLSATPGAIHRRAPRLGEHSEQILQGLGYSGLDIERLKASGAVT